MNRRFEALEGADISQALDTGTRLPRHSWASFCFAHSPIEAGC